MVAIVKVTRTLAVDVPELGAKIKQARMAAQQRGRTLTELAAAAKMSVQNWYRIEDERQSLPEETLKLIEDALEISFDVQFE